MIAFLFGLTVLTFMLWLGFKITGALLSACIWLFVLFPISMILMGLGVTLCCTILLIPVGVALLKLGCHMLILG